MNIRDTVLAAPSVTLDLSDNSRAEYFESQFGQIVGWVTNEDKRFLVDWLPGIASSYPLQPMRLVEIGTFSGSTARGLIVLSCGGTITCVDNWRDVHVENPRAQWENTLRNHGVDLLGHATLIEGDNKTIGENWNSPIDLLLIDSDHAYEGAISDMRNFANKVVRGGYCLVDDYQLPDVERACKEFFGDTAWTPVRIPETEAVGKLACWKRR